MTAHALMPQERLVSAHKPGHYQGREAHGGKPWVSLRVVTGEPSVARENHGLPSVSCAAAPACDRLRRSQLRVEKRRGIFPELLRPRPRVPFLERDPPRLLQIRIEVRAL